MKKSVIAHLVILLPAFLNAQNIGIGDPAPSAKLTVRGAETTADGQAAAIKLWNVSSTNSWYLRAGGLGTNTPPNGFSIGDNSGYHLVISQGGNIGIGINPATAKLHVNGAMKLEGTSLLEFGAGIAGKELNAGKIGYNGFGTNALAIVGAGTNTTNRAVYFFAEGGTTFSGPINLFGTFKVFGNQGNPGQVLTSNGSSAPTWTNAAFSNNTRFKVEYYTNETGSGNMNIVATEYNLNPSDITVSANSITINKSGLYRFNGAIVGRESFSGYPSVYDSELDCAIVLSGAMSDQLELATSDHLTRSNLTANLNFYIHKSFSIDMYIPAGTLVRISKNFQASAAVTLYVKFYGNLISE
jgi:hypothetical protein